MSKAIDVVLALDVSDSVGGEPLRQLKAAAHALVDVLRPEDSFSLLTFSSRVRLAVSPAGWHELDVRVRRPGVRVRARSGYAEEGG